MARSIPPTNKERKETMTTGKALDGKPYAGNPHVRFDEGEVAPAATPRRGSLLYKKLLMMIGAAAVAVGAFADGIVWEQAKNITGDADVRTNGVLRYAYANKTATVNGVQFDAGVWTASFPSGVVTMADVVLENVPTKYIDSNHFAQEVPAGASEGYLQLIRAGVYATSADAGGTVTSTVTLTNLIAGHDYIVQVWTHDRRADPGDYRSIKVDDVEELRFRTSNGFGQHVTGSFTATGESQSFTVVGYTERSDKTAVSQINSLQLRDVTPGCIDWEAAKDIADDSDVHLDGEPVFAAGWMAATATVNSVVFVPLAPTNSTTAYVDVRMTSENMPYARTDTFNQNVDPALSDDYHRLMGGATYKSANEVATVNLEGLMPGGRYLVQLWISDTRKGGPYRWASIDGGRRLHYKNGTYGQHIAGVFTADASSKAIRIRSLYTPSSSVSDGSPQLNAIQLRRLDGGTSTHWRVSHITKRDLDVRTDGDPLYAYNFSKGVTDAEINGVTFRGYYRNKALTSSNDDIGLVFPSAGNDNASAFAITDGDMSAGYLLMLQSATYPGSGSSDSTPSTLTLKRLVSGHRYLVQIWAHDGRSSTTTSDRYMDLDGAARLEYRNEGLFSPARGDVATGIFTATAATKTISMLSGHHSDLANRCVQMNGLQVRDLGVAEGLTILVEDVPAWHVAAGATVDLDGAARSLGVVSGEGVITNGTVTGTLALADGSAVTLAAVTLSSGVTLNGASSVTFAGGADLSGTVFHLADPAALAEMGRPAIATDGTLTGTPEFTFGRSGYAVKLTEEGYVVKKIRGLVISFH